MTSFVIVFFFAVTGWTLNHPRCLRPAASAGRRRPARSTRSWTNTGAADVAKLEIVEALRRAHHVGGALSDFRIDDDQLSVAFKGPGYSADAVIDRRTGKYELSRIAPRASSRSSTICTRGATPAASWKALIDVSAGLLTFISLTGLVLLYFIHKHRVAGFILLLAGGGLTGLIYWAWVP